MLDFETTIKESAKQAVEKWTKTYGVISRRRTQYMLTLGLMISWGVALYRAEGNWMGLLGLGMVITFHHLLFEKTIRYELRDDIYWLPASKWIPFGCTWLILYLLLRQEVTTSISTYRLSFVAVLIGLVVLVWASGILIDKWHRHRYLPSFILLLRHRHRTALDELPREYRDLTLKELAILCSLVEVEWDTEFGFCHEVSLSRNSLMDEVLRDWEGEVMDAFYDTHKVRGEAGEAGLSSEEMYQILLNKAESKEKLERFKLVWRFEEEKRAHQNKSEQIYEMSEDFPEAFWRAEFCKLAYRQLKSHPEAMKAWFQRCPTWQAAIESGEADHWVEQIDDFFDWQTRHYDTVFWLNDDVLLLLVGDDTASRSQ